VNVERLDSTYGPGVSSPAKTLVTPVNWELPGSAFPPTINPLPFAVSAQGYAGGGAVAWTPAAGTATDRFWLRLTLTSNVAYTVTPSIVGLVAGQLCILTVRNTIGGAAGAMTLAAPFKGSATTQPANGFSRTYYFLFDGTNLVETVKSVADVAN
jgi:hypothetical protein